MLQPQKSPVSTKKGRKSMGNYGYTSYFTVFHRISPPFFRPPKTKKKKSIAVTGSLPPGEAG
jgi:hypothetical protein